jgi:hypothetical protein
MDPLISAIPELIKLIFVGLLSGIIGAHISLKRYKHEKWWDMRACAYKDCVETLSDIADNYKRSYENWEDISQEALDTISKDISRDHSKVRKLRDMGAFLFSKKAEAVLTEYVEFDVDWNHVHDPDDIYGPYSKSARTCLEKLVAISKSDLGVHWLWC